MMPQAHSSQSHPQQHPARCPQCGAIASSSSVRRDDRVSTGDYLDSRGHIWQVKWFTGSAA